MAKKSIEGQNIEKTIVKRQEIKARIDDICRELTRFSGIEQRGIASAEARSRVDNLINKYGSENNIPENRVSEYAAFKADVDAKHAAYIAERQKKEALQKEHTDLQAELKSISRQATLDALLWQQAKVSDIENQIAELKRVIALEEAKIAQSNDDREPQGSLHHKYSELMADRALGKVVEQSSLDEIETQITEEKKRISQAKAAGSQAEIVIAGLKRKILDAEQILTPAKKTLQTVYCDYLITEAEKAGGEFVVLADQLWQKHLRLLALGTMIEQSPDASGTSIILARNRSFKIPAFNLESCQKNSSQDALLYPINDYVDVNAEIESLKRDIGALGVSI